MSYFTKYKHLVKELLEYKPWPLEQRVRNCFEDNRIVSHL